MNSPRNRLRAATSVAALLCLGACVTNPPQPVTASVSAPVAAMSVPATSGGCERLSTSSNQQRVATGAMVGAFVGGVIGATTGNKSRHVANGVLAGALVGALAARRSRTTSTCRTCPTARSSSSFPARCCSPRDSTA